MTIRVHGLALRRSPAYHVEPFGNTSFPPRFGETRMSTAECATMNTHLIRATLVLVIAGSAAGTCLSQRNDSTHRRDIVVGSARSHSKQLSAVVASIANNRAAVFIENRGQWGSTVRFLLRGDGLNPWITWDGVLYEYFTARRSVDTGMVRGRGGRHRNPSMQVRTCSTVTGTTS